MQTFIRRNQRKFVAVLAVVSMIAFVASTGSSWFGNGGNDPIIGHMAKVPVRASEMTLARHEWSLLQHVKIKNVIPGAADEAVPAIYLLGRGANMVQQDPDVFLLLQKEADALGLTAPSDAVEELMQNQTTLGSEATPDEVQDLRISFAALLKVKYAADRASSIVKVPRPQVQYELATNAQSISLKYVAFDANEFKAMIPAPTQGQLDQQFTRYAGTLAGQPTKENPFGFGYEYPNREKIEFLSVRHDDLKAAVSKTKSDAEWEIDARKQYLRHPDAYPAVKPSLSDTPKLPAGIAASQPTTRPLDFASYHDQIVNELVDVAVDALSTQVQSKLTTTMETDWVAFHVAVPSAALMPTTSTSQPTTMPATAAPMSSVGVAYNSDQYLPKLAAAIQQQLGVLPIVNRFDKDWLTETDLAGLPGIGSSYLSADSRQQLPTTFARYAIGYLDAFGHSPSAQDVGPTLSLFAPSPGLTDAANDLHFFRVIAADPAHPPTTILPLLAQVTADVIAAEAQGKSDEAAAALQTSAKSKGFDAAIAASGRKVLTAGPLRFGRPSPLPDLTLKPGSSQAINAGAFDLLKTGVNYGATQPLTVIPLPLDGKTILATPTAITPLYTEETRYLIENRLANQIAGGDVPYVQMMWLSPDNVRKRSNYTEEKKQPS